MRIQLLLLMTLGCVAACTRVTVFGRTVKDEPAPVVRTAGATPNAPAAQQAQMQIARITIELTPAAQQQVDGDPRFSRDDLRETITAELRARQLLDPQNPAAGRVAVIQLDEFTVRATSNVVMFGYLSSVGVLGGAIRIRDTANGELRNFRIRADIPMRISRNGKDRKPLEKLYERFAGLIADDLAATAPRPPQGQSRAD